MIFDDLRGLKALTRLFIQASCTGGLIFFSGVYIQSLGNIFGFGEILLGFWGIPFTIFCVVGMINAFNMIDGLNGLCASLCLVCFAAIIFMINDDTVPSLFPLILPLGAITGFLMYNLGILGNKRTVFLGDNGSNSLGFMCAWILVYFSSIDPTNFAPVTALWLVAIPFLDAVNVMFSRALKE
jgi:UDP-GlcNAc:undecaprenyl-phosphate GlcNAc-1-phosphate transferase